MKYSEAKPGRIFIIRLEDGEIIHEEIEKLFQIMPPLLKCFFDVTVRDTVHYPVMPGQQHLHIKI